MLEIGSLVDGKYRVLDEVGRGGMSVVYLARNIRTNKQWAIKEVRKDGTNDFEVVRSNLIAETDILKRLDHPNLPNIIDILDDGESFIIIMDFIEGNSLQHYLKYSGAQPQDDVVQWSIQLCDVLGYLHSRTPPIIYRDMKPANVMLKPDGNVSLIDFGTAREYKETSVEDTKCLGTQGYAAPEQYGGHGQTDARTDVYCLGATMYHLVTGHNPAEPPYEMYPIRQWNPNLSPGLEQIILKCTQKNPADRYQSCEELRYDLEHLDQVDPGVVRKQKRRLACFFTSLVLTVLFAVGCFTFGTLKSNTEEQSYDERVDAAETALGTDNESAIENLQAAIELSPEKKEAYYAYLNYIITPDSESGQYISNAEKTQMNTLLQSGTTVPYTSFKDGNSAEAVEFSYDYGRCLVLQSETWSNTAATPYLQYVVDSLSEDNAKYRVADCLLRYCELRQSSGNTLSTTSTQSVYKKFWDKAWKSTHDDNDAEMSWDELNASFNNDLYAEYCFYKMVVTQITTSKGDFTRDGVETEQMVQMVQLAEKMITEIDEEKGYNTAEIDFDQVYAVLGVTG